MSHAHQNFLWNHSELCLSHSPVQLVLQYITQGHAHQTQSGIKTNYAYVEYAHQTQSGINTNYAYIKSQPPDSIWD